MKYKKLFESWRRVVSDETETEKNYKYFEQAIEFVDTYEDYAWTMNDFKIEELGLLTLEELARTVHFPDNIRRPSKELEGMSPEERIRYLPELDSNEKREAALKYINNPESRPPLVLVAAPDTDHDSLYTRIGYGIGLITLHLALGINDMKVYKLNYIHEVKKKGRNVPGTTGYTKYK